MQFGSYFFLKSVIDIRIGFMDLKLVQSKSTEINTHKPIVGHLFMYNGWDVHDKSLMAF